MKYTSLVILLSAILAPAGFAAIPSALPSFKSERQLTIWRDEQATKSTTTTASESSEFYTGKPYVHSSKGYAFKYRTYTPVESRWTSEDPSGFPDGANPNIYSPIPTTSIDYQGLSKTVITFERYSDDITNDYGHDQMMLDAGMSPINALFLTSAAYTAFQNSIRQAYSIGDQVIKGPRVGVETKIVDDNATLQSGYPKYKITGISFSKEDTFMANGGYKFHAIITSQATYKFE